MKKIILLLVLLLIVVIAFCQETTINKNQKAIDLRLGLGITGIMGVYALAPVVFSSNYQVEIDKIYHFAAGAVIAGVTTSLCYRITKKNNLSMGIGFVAGCAANFAKEYIWDKKLGHGIFNKNDIISGCAGSGFGAFTVSAVISLNHDKKSLKRYD
jgi:hypothetical protein